MLMTSNMRPTPDRDRVDSIAERARRRVEKMRTGEFRQLRGSGPQSSPMARACPQERGSSLSSCFRLGPVVRFIRMERAWGSTGGGRRPYRRPRQCRPGWPAPPVPVLQQRFESQRCANRRVLGDASRVSGAPRRSDSVMTSNVTRNESGGLAWSHSSSASRHLRMFPALAVNGSRGASRMLVCAIQSGHQGRTAPSTRAASSRPSTAARSAGTRGVRGREGRRLKVHGGQKLVTRSPSTRSIVAGSVAS